MSLFVSFGSRYLENQLILVQAQLLVPCDHVSRKVPYKYVVFKAKRREKDKHLWECLVDWGGMTNRCLCIPKDRCQTGGIIIWCNFFFLFISWEPFKWTAYNCLQIMDCSFITCNSGKYQNWWWAGDLRFVWELNIR